MATCNYCEREMTKTTIMKIHDLKTDHEVFQDVWLGRKKFEIRFNDRDFQVGDELRLHETECTGEQMKLGADLEYTGRTVTKVIGHVLKGPIYGLRDGWVILSFV